MHSIGENGELIPEKCSGYPFCDTCAPEKLMPIKFEIGDIVVLEGISLHGKNRIREHGTKYRIREIRRYPQNDRLLLENDTDLRWIYVQRDENFKIIGGIYA